MWALLHLGVSLKDLEPNKIHLKGREGEKLGFNFAIKDITLHPFEACEVRAKPRYTKGSKSS